MAVVIDDGNDEAWRITFTSQKYNGRHTSLSLTWSARLHDFRFVPAEIPCCETHLGIHQQGQAARDPIWSNDTCEESNDLRVWSRGSWWKRCDFKRFHEW